MTPATVMAIGAVLIQGLPVGLWSACLGCSIAWLSRGTSPIRLIAFALALLWPVVPIWSALHAREMARQAEAQFVSLCQKQARQQIFKQQTQVAEVFIDQRISQKRGESLRGAERITPLQLLWSQPGYKEVHLISQTATGETFARVVRDKHENAFPEAPIDDSLARFGVRFESMQLPENRGLVEHHAFVFDRMTNEVFAEQINFAFTAPKITLLGLYPLFLAQDRTCPLPSSRAFIQSVLLPQ